MHQLAGEAAALPCPFHADYGSWLNLVERWFAELTNEQLRREFLKNEELFMAHAFHQRFGPDENTAGDGDRVGVGAAEGDRSLRTLLGYGEYADRAGVYALLLSRRPIALLQRRHRAADESRLVERSMADGKIARLTELDDRRDRVDYVFAADGRYQYFTWREDDGSIWVMDVVKDVRKSPGPPVPARPGSRNG